MSFLIYLILGMQPTPTKPPSGPPVYVPICIPGHPKCNHPPPAPRPEAPHGNLRGRK